jgi:hypothetical protein
VKAVAGATSPLGRNQPALIEISRDKDRLSLLQRASAAEGQFEALLVKLAVERRLESEDLEALSRFERVSNAYENPSRKTPP